MAAARAMTIPELVQRVIDEVFRLNSTLDLYCANITKVSDENLESREQSPRASRFRSHGDLYSCILVNRTWYEAGISRLWQIDPPLEAFLHLPDSRNLQFASMVYAITLTPNVQLPVWKNAWKKRISFLPQLQTLRCFGIGSLHLLRLCISRNLQEIKMKFPYSGKRLHVPHELIQENCQNLRIFHLDGRTDLLDDEEKTVNFLENMPSIEDLRLLPESYMLWSSRASSVLRHLGSRPGLKSVDLAIGPWMDWATWAPLVNGELNVDSLFTSLDRVALKFECGMFRDGNSFLNLLCSLVKRVSHFDLEWSNTGELFRARPPGWINQVINTTSDRLKYLRLHHDYPHFQGARFRWLGWSTLHDIGTNFKNLETLAIDPFCALDGSSLGSVQPLEYAAELRRLRRLRLHFLDSNESFNGRAAVSTLAAVGRSCKGLRELVFLGPAVDLILLEHEPLCLFRNLRSFTFKKVHFLAKDEEEEIIYDLKAVRVAEQHFPLLKTLCQNIRAERDDSDEEQNERRKERRDKQRDKPIWVY